jgi:hypothetical protein
MPRAFFPTLFCGETVSPLELRELATQVYFSTGKTSQGCTPLQTAARGRRQILAFALPGDFLGMPRADRHNFSADAIGAVASCRFSRDDLTKFIQTSPSIMRLLIEFEIRQLNMAQCPPRLPYLLPLTRARGFSDPV